MLNPLALEPYAGQDILPPHNVTFGLSVMMRNALPEGFSADCCRISLGTRETAPFDL